MKKVRLAPSLLSADQVRIFEAVREVENSGADTLHIDVMDGHFVPNLTFGLPLIKSLKKVTKLPIDVHIMVSNPDQVAASYVEAGADQLCFHIEASTHPHRTLHLIKSLQCKAGIALNPGTSLESVKHLLSDLDMILFMSVNPGFSGQKFIPNVYDKLEELQKCTPPSNLIVGVDGGVSDQNIGKLSQLGANFFVVGSYFFSAKDKKEAVKKLQSQVR